MKKTILCLYAPANSGKTSTIRLFDEILHSCGARLVKVLLDEADICKEYIFRTHKVGILSLGDPGSAQSGYLEQLANDDCEVTVCTSRSKGTTCDSVSKIATKYDEIYWISPLYEYDSKHPLAVDMHDLNARFLIKAILHVFN